MEVIIRTTEEGFNGGRSYIYRSYYNDAVAWEAEIDKVRECHSEGGGEVGGVRGGGGGGVDAVEVDTDPKTHTAKELQTPRGSLHARRSKRSGARLGQLRNLSVYGQQLSGAYGCMCEGERKLGLCACGLLRT